MMIQKSINFSLNILYKLSVYRRCILLQKNTVIASTCICIPRTLKNIAIQIMRITMTEKGSKFTYAHYLTMLHIMSDRVHIKYTK